MTNHPGFVARSLVRSYSNKLKNVQEVDVDKSFPRQQLEDAFVEESERQDRLAELLQNASSRFVITTRRSGLGVLNSRLVLRHPAYSKLASQNLRLLQKHSSKLFQR